MPRLTISAIRVHRLVNRLVWHFLERIALTRITQRRYEAFHQSATVNYGCSVNLFHRLSSGCLFLAWFFINLVVILIQLIALAAGRLLGFFILVIFIP